MHTAHALLGFFLYLVNTRFHRYHSGLHHHPSDSDAGWNSTQHPTWPEALSEEFTPAVNDW